MRTIKQKLIGAVVLFVAVVTAQSVFAYYNPSTGRFLSRDPAGEPGFQALQIAQGVSQVPIAQQSSRWISRDSVNPGESNPYRYVLNNPVDYLDPDGRDTWVPYPYPGHWVSDPQPPPAPPDPVGFALCKRDVNPEGVLQHAMLIGFRILHPQTPTDHAYLHYKHCEKCERVGLGIGGTKPGAPPIPEHKFGPTDCKPCKRTGDTLQYGATTKTGAQATDAEIWDCISKVSTSHNYQATGKGHYNCMDWAKEAASKCGLNCN